MIKLDDSTFTIEANGVTFLFSHDKRSFLSIILSGFNTEVIAERAEKDLIDIKGAVTASGDKITKADFNRLPLTLYSLVIGQYTNKISEIIKESSSDESELKKNNVQS